MSVLGSIQYEFSADARPLIGASKESIKAFEEMDRAAKKADTSIKGVEKSHSALGKAIRTVVVGGAVTGLGLLTRHLLEGTKAGEQLNKGLGFVAKNLQAVEGRLSEGVRPLRAWVTSTEAGTKVVTGLEKGVSALGRGFQGLDALTGRAAQGIKDWTGSVSTAAKAGGVMAAASVGLRGALLGIGGAVVSGAQGLKSWVQGLIHGSPVASRFGGSVAASGAKVATFGKVARDSLHVMDELAQGMVKAQLGAVALAGGVGKAAVGASHLSEYAALLGSGMALMGGKMGLAGVAVMGLSQGISGLTALLGGLVTAVGMVADAFGERLLEGTRVWLEQFAQVQVTVLGFDRAVQAYNASTKDARVSTEELEGWMSNLGRATGTATVDLRQATLRALELSKVTGLTTHQVQQLTERAIDLSTAMHRDLWDAVWAVLDAMRGFPMMASGFGIALDAETLKTSEFTQALGRSFDALTEHQKSQVMFQETMKQSAWASGLAAEQLGTTLVGAARRSEQAFTRLHTELGKGAAIVWEPYTTTVATLISELNLIPGPLVQAAGALQAFAGVALKTVGFVLRFAGALTTFGVAVLAVTKGLPALGNGIIWLANRVMRGKREFTSLGEVLVWLTVSVFVGFWNILKGTAKQLWDYLKVLGAFTAAHPIAAAAIVALGAAIYGVVKAYQHYYPSAQKVIESMDKEKAATEERIRSLKALREEVGKEEKIDAAYREILLKIAKDHPPVLELLRKEKLVREDIVGAIDETVEAQKRQAAMKEGEALAAITEKIKEQKLALTEVHAARLKIQQEMRDRTRLEKEMAEVAKYDALAGGALEYTRSLSAIGKELGEIEKKEKKAGEELKKWEGELHKIVPIRKEEQKVIATTADLMQHLSGLTEQEIADIKGVGEAHKNAEAIITDVFRKRFELLDEAAERERAQAESILDAHRELGKQRYELETTGLKSLERAHQSYTASLISQVTQSNKGLLDSMQIGAQEYFDNLKRFEREGLQSRLRSVDVFGDSLKMLDKDQEESARLVFTGLEDRVGTLYAKTTSAGKDAVQEFSDVFRGSLKKVDAVQEGFAQDTSRRWLAVSRDFSLFSDTIQEAYKKISGGQKNYLRLLMEAGPASQDIAQLTVHGLREVDKAYGDQITNVQRLIGEFKKHESEQERLNELDLRLMNLRKQRLEALVQIFQKAYTDMEERQRRLQSLQEQDLGRLQSLQQEHLQRTDQMEKVLRELKIKSGELVMSDQEKWYAELKDLDIQYTRSRGLSAEERRKIDQNLTASYLGMVKEITDANGNVIISERQAAQEIERKIIPLWKDEQQATKAAAAELEESIKKRAHNMQELGKQMEVARAGMEGLRQEHNQLSREIAAAEYKITITVENKARKEISDLKVLLDAVTIPRKIVFNVDLNHLTTVRNILKQIENSLSRIGQLRSGVTIMKPATPAPPASAPAAPARGPGAGGVAGTPGEISRAGFQQGGQVAGKIPGHGGGDKVLISALPGQFVLRKEAVSQLGSGLLAALSRAPDARLGGSQLRQPVPIAVEPGEFIVPQEAVLAQGVGFFEHLNRMQEGGDVRAPSWMGPQAAEEWLRRHKEFILRGSPSLPISAVLALQGRAPGGTSAESRMDEALRYTSIWMSGRDFAPGVGEGGVSQLDRARSRFNSAGGYLTQSEFEQIAPSLPQAQVSLLRGLVVDDRVLSLAQAIFGVVDSSTISAVGGRGKKPTAEHAQRFVQELFSGNPPRALSRNPFTLDEIRRRVQEAGFAPAEPPPSALPGPMRAPRWSPEFGGTRADWEASWKTDPFRFFPSHVLQQGVMVPFVRTSRGQRILEEFNRMRQLREEEPLTVQDIIARIRVPAAPAVVQGPLPGKIRSMPIPAFDTPTPPAFLPSVGLSSFRQGGLVGGAPDTQAMRTSASQIDTVFSELFSGLERKAGAAASMIGRTLFESLYTNLKDRLIREARMG